MSNLKGRKGKDLTKHDALFKTLLVMFFVEFMDLFLPQATEVMDTSHLIFLREEIISEYIKFKKYCVDILVETKLKDEERVVLLHVESQAQRVAGYNEQMYRYFAELYKKYQKKIIPIVIYSHDAKLEEPDNFVIEFPFLKTLEFKFFKIQLRKESWKKYIQSNNPVAAALISKMDWTEREKIQVKVEFARMLSRMNLSDEKNEFLVTFFETYLSFTEKEEEIYLSRIKNELDEKEVEKCMEFVSSYRLKGRAEGIEIGRKEGEIKGKIEGKIEGRIEAMKEVARKMLSENMLVSKIIEITGLSSEEIQKFKQKEYIL